MDGNPGGYNNLNHFPLNVPKQGSANLPQPRYQANLPEQFGVWEPPTATRSTTVCHPVLHNHEQQSNASNMPRVPNIHRIDNAGSINRASGQYGISNDSYKQMPPLYHSNDPLNSNQFFQNNSTSSSTYVQNNSEWPAPASNQASNSNQNYNPYRATVMTMTQSNLPVMPIMQQNLRSVPVTQSSISVDPRQIPANSSADITRSQPDVYLWRDSSSTSTFNVNQNPPPVQKTYPATTQIEWNKFKNPLNDSQKEEDTVEVLVNRMHQAAGKSQSILEQTCRKPNTFSKSALAQLENDLKEASTPFASAESLKEFRNLQLGIPSDDIQENNSVMLSNKSTSRNENVRSNLSANANEFVPRNNYSVPVKPTEESSQSAAETHDPEVETNALNLIDDFIEQVTCEPACFDEVVPHVVAKLRESNLTKSVISVLVDKIYEMCVLEQNFRYLGSQLCDKLSRTDTGLPSFRSLLLVKAQNEFKVMDSTLEHRPERAINFTQFMAELFLSLMCEGNDGLERFAVLGRATFGVVRKLIDHPNNDNIQCAIRVLKLTIVSMEESLKTDKQNSMEKLKSVVDDLEDFRASDRYPLDNLTKALLDGFIKLRANNWGQLSESSDRGEGSSQHKNPADLSKQDENYYMNEPVFFTPSGVMYTAADAIDPEFYCLHLAKESPAEPTTHKASNPEVRSVPPQPANAFYKNPLDAEPTAFNRMPYTNWTIPEGGDCFDDDTQEDILCDDDDDYDEELEAFLQSIVQ